ncbi:hypothetical protein CALCODRAFT_494359 [Calocera cornea HHB12733]|uniref:Uncharacterized protein n=1 Tax=Calocera cornea HHB12733 TaxID=1353952 RepID=A0A165H5L0_9BASI|nr:hypothetical protein CALCODRAFT_494359 [Calocera cornea HHB12733]
MGRSLGLRWQRLIKTLRVGTVGCPTSLNGAVCFNSPFILARSDRVCVVLASMQPVLPVELRLYVLNALVDEVDSSSYAWPPEIGASLLHLSQLDRNWRSVATTYVYRHLVVHSAPQIKALLALSDNLEYAESLALLPGRWDSSNSRVVDGNHSFCTDDLAPLLGHLSSTLKRLFIMHLQQDEPRCTLWSDTISRLTALQELIVDRYEGILPHRLVTIRQGASQPEAREQRTIRSSGRFGSSHQAEIPHQVEVSTPHFRHSSAENSPNFVGTSTSRPTTGSGISSDNDAASPAPSDGTDSDHDLDAWGDRRRFVPSWPFLPSILRLATSGPSLLWKDFQFTDYFPRVEQLVFVDYDWIEDSPSQIGSMRRQLRRNPSLRVVVVEQERSYVRRDWQEDMTRLPPDRFYFHLYDPSQTSMDGPWLVQHALRGGLFDVGSSFSDLRPSPEP